MADYRHSTWEEMERPTQEHTLCYHISGQEFVDEETRDTNVIMEKAAEEAAIELEKIPSISSAVEEIPLFSSISGPLGKKRRGKVTVIKKNGKKA